MEHNGSGLAEDGDFLSQKFNRITNVEPCENAQLKNFSRRFWQTLVTCSCYFLQQLNTPLEFYSLNV